MAYNSDFTAYVTAALEAHGMPVDPKMDWSKWLNTVYRRYMPTISEESRDEAIHEMLGHFLFEADILSKFDPDRLKESLQAQPLAEQISSYLKMYFIWKVDWAIKYLKKLYPSEEIAVGLTNDESPNGRGGESTPSILNRIQHGVVDPEEEELIQNTEIRKLRHAFETWCDRTLSADKATRMKHFFDLLVIFDGPQQELLEEFANKAGVSPTRARQTLYYDLPRLLRQFAASPEGKNFSLAKRIRTKIEQERDKATEPQPAPSTPAPANP
jgi:hypothetical protein